MQKNKSNAVAKRVSFNAETFKGLGEAGRRIKMAETLEKTLKVTMLFACQVKAALEEGDDLSWIPKFKRQCFIRIAEGTLFPEAFDKYISTQVGRRIYQLPMTEQKAFAEGKTVKVYQFNGGAVDYREVDPLELSNLEVAQVFDRTGIRNAAEQRSWFETQKKKKVIKEAFTKDEGNIKWEFDKAHKVMIGRLDGRIVSRLEAEFLSASYLKLMS